MNIWKTLLLRTMPVIEKVNRLKQDRKSTRLNSSNMSMSYAVFCLKKKTFAEQPPRSLDRGVALLLRAAVASSMALLRGHRGALAPFLPFHHARQTVACTARLEPGG